MQRSNPKEYPTIRQSRTAAQCPLRIPLSCLTAGTGVTISLAASLREPTGAENDRRGGMRRATRAREGPRRITGLQQSGDTGHQPAFSEAGAAAVKQ